MRKSKLLNYSVIVVFFGIMLWVFNIENVNAATCPGLDKMLNDFGIKSSHKIVSGNKQMTVTFTKGDFKLISYELKGLNEYDQDGNKISTSADINLLTDLKTSYIDPKTVFNSSNSMVINAKVGKKGAEIVLHFGLVNAYSGCKPYDESTDTVTYSIIVRNDEVNNYIANPHYNTYCTALRDGTDYDKKFTDVIGKWKASNKDTYKKIISYCFEEYVQFQMNETSLITNIKNVIKNVDSFTSEISPVDPSFEERWNNATTKNPKGDVTKENNLRCSYIGNGSGNYLGTNLSYNKTDAAGNVVKDAKTGIPLYNIDANVVSFKNEKSSNETVEYKYNYTIVGNPSLVSETVDVCTVKCREVIELRYGPPVASVAGMCFEYSIQATSWVSCDADIHYENAPREGSLCSPVPYCNQYAGYTHQGGPNEEYKSCINQCDGGKYTKSCSNKCYDKVYNKTASKTKRTFNDLGDISASKTKSTSDFKFQVNNGKYIYRNGYILWQYAEKDANGVEHYYDAKGYSRYYLENEFWRTYYDHGSSSGDYTYDEDGFKVNIHSDGSTCSDPCQYYVSHCYGDNLYLNREEIYDDYEANLDAFNTTVATCLSKATCSTKTSTIDLKVVNDGKKDYYESSDWTSSTCSAPIKSKFIEYGDCYNGCKGGTKYRAKWGTSGTWLNIKGGLSYKEMSLTDGWYEEEKKFCSPRTASNVNVKWWNYYYHKFVVDNNYSAGGSESLLNKALKEANACSKDSDGSLGDPVDATKLDPDNSSDINWNINSKVRDFGYLGWNFDVNCFYALFACYNGCTPGTPGCDHTASYMVRSFDPADMFPSTTGEKSTDHTLTSRDPGFNWTPQAAGNTKNDGYVIDPTGVIAETQQVSEGRTSPSEGGIYDEHYLDYEVVLSPSAIKAIRDKTDNYTNFTYASYSVDKNSVVRYQSPLLKDGNEYGIKVTRPTGDLYKCNNIDGNRCK